MSLQLIMHDVSGEGNHCFYRAIYQALRRSDILADLDRDTGTEKLGIVCLRSHVAALVRTSANARVVVKTVLELAHAGIIESGTIMAEYAKMYPESYLTDSLDVTLDRFAHIMMTQKVMADSLDFLMMNNWLNKYNISLYNITFENAVSSEKLIKLITGSWQPLQEFVIFINTDNTHYKWVSMKYMTDARKTQTTIVNRENLVNLLSVGDPEFE